MAEDRQTGNNFMSRTLLEIDARSENAMGAQGFSINFGNPNLSPASRASASSRLALPERLVSPPYRMGKD
jgi:hypothetical protein